jgi:hypothetical protein
VGVASVSTMSRNAPTPAGPREVASLVEGESTAGPGMARWSTTGMPPGLYLARLESPGLTPIVRHVVVTH